MGSDVLKELAALGVTGGFKKRDVAPTQRVPKAPQVTPKETLPKVESAQLLEDFFSRVEALELDLKSMLERCASLRKQTDLKLMLEWCAQAKEPVTEEASEVEEADQEDAEASKVEESVNEATTKQDEPTATAAEAEHANDEVQGQEGDQFGNPAWVRNIPGG